MATNNNRVKSTNDLELKDRLVAINRVTKVTKGGRTFTFAAIVVVGNENGIVGWGLGKANEVQAAIAKGVEAAKKNLIKVPVHKGTIPHEQFAKFGGSRVLLKPASTGTGVKAGGATLFRGGAYKPRTSPYSFQGLETEGILDMVKAREATGLPIVSELMSEDRIPEFEEYVDVVQIGARNMQNFQLLKAVGKMHKPVLLKRGLCNTIEEWIMSAEYIMAGGNEQVILCERGIRTFEKYTRNTLDLSAVPIIHEKTHLPIIVDPSHATGKANLVEPMMIAAVAAGADGLEVEVHYDPRHAWSDGAQCLTPDAFAQAMAKCRQVAWAIGRDM